jgi:hypothetical protein
MICVDIGKQFRKHFSEIIQTTEFLPIYHSKFSKIKILICPISHFCEIAKTYFVTTLGSSP